MSFILDSLKKAERERRMGAEPAIQALYEEDAPPAGPRPRRRTWLAGILLVNLAALALIAGIVLHQREVPEKLPSPDAADRRATVETAAPHPTAAKPAEADAPAVEPRAHPSPPPVAAAPPALEVKTEAKAPRQDRSRPPAVRFGPPVAASVGETARRPAVRRTISAAVTPMTAAAETPPAAEAPDEQAPEASETTALTEPRIQADGPQTPRAPATSPTSPATVASKAGTESSTPMAAPPPLKETVPDAAQARIPRTPRPAATAGDLAAARPMPAAPQEIVEQVPLLQELPPELREKFRNVRISVLVYDARPEASVVYIDSRRYHAGDRIGSEGYVLERITPDGIVLDYGDGKVKIGTGR